MFRSLLASVIILFVSSIQGNQTHFAVSVIIVKHNILYFSSKYSSVDTFFRIMMNFFSFLYLPDYSIRIFTRLKLCLADAIHNFK